MKGPRWNTPRLWASDASHARYVLGMTSVVVHVLTGERHVGKIKRWRPL